MRVVPINMYHCVIQYTQFELFLIFMLYSILHLTDSHGVDVGTAAK